MRIFPGLLDPFHLDSVYCLMDAVQVRLLHQIFKFLDIHASGKLNDVQIYDFLNNITDLKEKEIYKVFDTLDTDGSGDIDFEEFYFLICILVAVKDKNEKAFIHKHARAVFDLLDYDGSRSVSAREFQNFGFLFNLTGLAIHKIFRDFDISGDQELNFKEFQMFAIACTDAQRELEMRPKNKNIVQRIFSRIKSFFGLSSESSSTLNYDTDSTKLQETARTESGVSSSNMKESSVSLDGNIWKAYLPHYQKEAEKENVLVTKI